ncbi:MAG TPA: response regulator [Candidatus Limnocylindria bacterium]|nr:response regulator [Candidatus Limnocylindria bacterium]
MAVNAPTVLHVEDDPNDVLLIARAFRKAEIPAQLQVVNDGEQAVHYLSGTNSFSSREQFPLPSLVLLDLKLPRKSGIEVLEWVRTQPGLKRIPIVMLTSSKQPIDINRAYDLGVNAYLVKPVNFDSLVEMLKTLDSFWLRVNEQPSASRE